MKSIITLLSILILSVLNSQDNKSITKIIYKQTIDMGEVAFNEEYELLFEKNSSFYELIDDNEVSVKTTEKEEAIGRQTNVVSGRKKGLKNFFYNNSNSNFYCQSIHNGEHILLTKEEGNKIDWKIQKEFKDISGFKCQKATGIFRGREYVAWFTPEIPVPFGPWKLHGTPGLILEAYDTDQMIYLVAKSVFSNTDISLPNKIKKIDFSKAISMNEKFRKVEEFQQEELAKINAQLPQGMKPFKIDKNCKDCPKPLEIFD